MQGPHKHGGPCVVACPRRILGYVYETGAGAMTGVRETMGIKARGDAGSYLARRVALIERDPHPAQRGARRNRVT